MPAPRASASAGAGRAVVAVGPVGRDVDAASSQRRAAGYGIDCAREDAWGAQQVVRHGCTQDPGGVGAEPPRRYVGQRSVDEIGEHRLDDRVLAVSDVGLGDGQVGAGEERVISPHGNESSR